MKEDSLKEVGRIVAGAYQDMQSVRIATLGRIRDIFRKRLEGIKSDEVEKKKKEKDFETKYSDGELPDLLKKLEKKGKLTQKEYSYIERCLAIAQESAKIENKYKKAMMEYVQTEPIYTVFLNKIRGIGEVLSANLIKEFGYCEVIVYDKKKKRIIGREKGDKKGFEEALKKYEQEKNLPKEERRYIMRGYMNKSKLWAHTGNAVIGGVAPRKIKGENVRYSPRLRTLTWKISDCLMKHNHGIYRQIYTTEKQKQLAKKYEKGELKRVFRGYEEKDTQLKIIHAHNRALRKMRKLFLCYSPDTKIMTKRGIIPIPEIKSEDLIATLNYKGELEYQMPSNILDYDYDGELINFDGRGYNFLVTPNHKMLVRYRRKKNNSPWVFEEAQSLFNKKRLDNLEFKRDAKWIGKDVSEIMGFKNKEDWLLFFGWWLGDGHAYKNPKSKGGYSIGITCFEPSEREQIIDIIKRIGFVPYYYEKSKQIIISSKRLYGILKPFGKARDKYVPEEIKELRIEDLMFFLEGLEKSDGQIDDKGRLFRYTSVSKRLIDDIAEIALKCGYGISIVKRRYNSNLTKKEAEMYVLTLTRDKKTPRITIMPKKSHYKGKVYCVTVPNHTLLVTRKNSFAWCGNSHYWSCSRELMELPCVSLYEEEKLGHKDIITWREAIAMEK